VIPNKIKTGFGEHVCEILIALLNTTLKNKRVNLLTPVFPRSDDNSKLEKEIGGEEDDSVDYDGGNPIEDDDGDEIAIVGDMNSDNKKVIESKANEKEWKMECEQVKRKLESVTGSDSKEWRQHIERSKELSELIQESVVGV
jgi:estrogen-related receptor beta like 1